jgi:hypothetical protein
LEIWVKEIVEQVCVAKILSESKVDSANRLALITIDNAFEFGLKFYASYNGLLHDKQLDAPDAFFQILKLLEGKEVTVSDSKDARQYHKLRNDLYHRAKLTTVKKSVVDGYVVLAQRSFGTMFGKAVPAGNWDRIAASLRKELSGSGAKEPVEYEQVTVESVSLIKLRYFAALKTTDAVCLIVHGFVSQYLRHPSFEDVKKSLMLSGQSDITDPVLRATIFNLRKQGYLEGDKLKLKGKALENLRRNFIV